jgi:hypothetical protein
LLMVNMPHGLVDMISIYAKTSGHSENATYRLFLERGLLMYMKGENTLLETSKESAKNGAS